jgi:hypothetical protein
MVGRYCPSCGAAAHLDDVYCGHCGAVLSQSLVGLQTPASRIGWPGARGSAPMQPAPAAMPLASTPAGQPSASLSNPAATLRLPRSTSASRAVGVTAAVAIFALLLLLAEVALRSGGSHAPRLNILLAGLTPTPLVVAVTFWVGVVLLARIDAGRSWLAALALSQLLFGLTAVIETTDFGRYLRQAVLLPTATLGLTRNQVLGLTSVHTLFACLIGMGLAQGFAPWAELRARRTRGVTLWLATAIIAAVVAIVALHALDASILRLAAIGALSPGNRWVQDVVLTGAVVTLYAIIGGAVGWSFARETA